MTEQLRILVVDDEPGMRTGIERTLRRFSVTLPDLEGEVAFGLEAVDSGEAALARIEANPPDILLLDHKLPGMSGLDVLHELAETKRDILTIMITAYRALDLDMIGIGPYISHPATPLGSGDWRHPLPAEAQVPNTELVVYKTVALSRLLCPEANIPSTTALATINRDAGRELGLLRGANIVMPNLTPLGYREKYEIYPGKACINESAQACQMCLRQRIQAIGRHLGSGPGGRTRGGAVR